MPHGTEQPDGGVEGARPEWFAAFLADRGTRKPSAHTLKAYRQDFDAIAALIAGGQVLSGVALGSITIDTMRTAFARYAQTHEAASIQRCWSTWNVLCTYLYTAALIGSNPMPRHRPDRGVLLNHPGFRAHLPLREGWRDGPGWFRVRTFCLVPRFVDAEVSEDFSLGAGDLGWGGKVSVTSLMTMVAVRRSRSCLTTLPMARPVFS